ncbi:chaperonin 10-like protein [Ilyonectria sp. MPI-CAGE-AT-0026]|nr:chaperonin 10-like protein [Ilyonectria sp. MPI-CAGE-AT-0026]
MEKIPKKHKAIIYSKPGTIKTEVVEVDTPSPGYGEVLIRLTYSGVCHTDYAFMMQAYGHMPDPTPVGQIGGHEGVGSVVQLGEGVDNVAVGDRLGVKWITSACLTCGECLAGFDNRCKRRKVSGYKTPGTFQQYIVTDPKYATPIPDKLSSEAAAPLLCGGVTVWSALLASGAKLGDWLGVSGAGGGLGHLAVQYAKSFGMQVVAVDHGSKGEFCKSVGADAFLDFTKFGPGELAAEVKKITNGGCQAVLVCNSSSKSYDEALSLLRYAGTLVCVGIPEIDPHPMPDTAPYKLIMNQWTIRGAVTGNRIMAVDCLLPAATGQVNPALKIVPMDQLTETFEAFKKGTINGRVVLDLS